MKQQGRLRVIVKPKEIDGAHSERHCVRCNYNAVWLHNPNQGAITTEQGDDIYTRMEITRHTTQA